MKVFSKIKNLFKKFKNKNFFYLWMKFSKYINGCISKKWNWIFGILNSLVFRFTKILHNKSWKKVNKIKILISIFEL